VVSFTLWLLYPEERASGTHWIGSVGPRDSLDEVREGKFLTLPGLELQSLGFVCPVAPKTANPALLACLNMIICNVEMNLHGIKTKETP
jgi:hypothetical protein